MGFNYLQTDDRDDYFERFEKKRNKRKVKSITLIDPNGVIVIENAPVFAVRGYGKRNVFPPGQNGKYVWRKLLEDSGYKVINNFI